jgi:hypothetical protein
MPGAATQDIEVRLQSAQRWQPSNQKLFSRQSPTLLQTKPELLMKTLFFVISLASALLALPASAQQGPAGVPGAPGLAPIVQPQPVQQVAQAKPAKRAPQDCNKAKDIEQCKARQQARKIAREACKNEKGAEHKQCVRDALAAKK